MIPMDYRVPKIRIKTRQADQLTNSRVVCRLDGWDTSSKYLIAFETNCTYQRLPSCSLISSYLPFGSLREEAGRNRRPWNRGSSDIGGKWHHYYSIFSRCILIYSPLNFTFPSLFILSPSLSVIKWFLEILQSLPPFSRTTGGFKVPPAELKYRRDLRKIRVFSIDPLGSQDIYNYNYKSQCNLLPTKVNLKMTRYWWCVVCARRKRKTDRWCAYLNINPYLFPS